MKILNHSPLRNARGMTLVEILIVLAIVGSLMAVIGGTVMDKFQKAKVRETGLRMSQLVNGINEYYGDCDKMPTSLQNLIQSPGDECANWGPKPYVKKDVLKDAWSNEFVYSSDGAEFQLKSLGKDKKEGGDGFNKDITNEPEENAEK